MRRTVELWNAHGTVMRTAIDLSSTVPEIGELCRGSDGAPDRVPAGPTNEVWIDPGYAHPTALGVQFRLGHTITGLDLAGGRITGARYTDPRGGTGTIDADWYVLAVPVERAVPLMTHNSWLPTRRWADCVGSPPTG